MNLWLLLKKIKETPKKHIKGTLKKTYTESKITLTKLYKRTTSKGSHKKHNKNTTQKNSQKYPKKAGGMG